MVLDVQFIWDFYLKEFKGTSPPIALLQCGHQFILEFLIIIGLKYITYNKHLEVIPKSYVKENKQNFFTLFQQGCDRDTCEQCNITHVGHEFAFLFPITNISDERFGLVCVYTLCGCGVCACGVHRSSVGLIPQALSILFFETESLTWNSWFWLGWLVRAP